MTAPEPQTTIGKFVAHPFFRRFSLVLIIAACVLIGIETNHVFYAENYAVLHTLDIIAISLFGLELLLQYVADIYESKAQNGRYNFLRYFSDPWHILDIIVVGICLLPNSEFFAVFRTLRILRVFLLIDELPRLKILVNALVKSIPSMSYVILLLLLHFYSYAVVGTDIFGRHHVAAFSSLNTSMMTLFQVVTADGWIEIMNSTFTTANTLPKWSISLYFISFIVIGAMIFLNLFIGVITNEIAELKAENDREKFLEKRSKEGVTTDSTLRDVEMQLASLQQSIHILRASLPRNKAQSLLSNEQTANEGSSDTAM